MDDETIGDQEPHTTVLKNEYLFKSYLLVKILKSNLKNARQIQEKLLLNLINCLLGKRNEPSEQDLVRMQEIFNCLYLMCSKYYDDFVVDCEDIQMDTVEQKLSKLIDQTDLVVETNFLSSVKKFFRPTVNKILHLLNLKKSGTLSVGSMEKLDNLVLKIIEKLIQVCDHSEHEELQIVLKDIEFLLEFFKNSSQNEPGKHRVRDFVSKSCTTIIGTDLKRKISPIENDRLTNSSSSISILKCKKIRRLSSTSIPSILSSNQISKELISNKRNQSLFYVIKQANNVNKSKDKKVDIVSKLFPLSLSVNKLPGIGKVYANRLKEHKMSSLGDLVQFYESKCARNRTKFSSSIKYMTYMKSDTINKLIRIMQTVIRNKR